MLPKLDRIEELLRKYGIYVHADQVAECRKLLAAEGASAYANFATLQWWGGSGSNADLCL